MTERDTNTYNMKVVLEETGVKPDTLRAWERRYGLPTPERSKGGHRLYSRHDIEMVKWLTARQEEGLSISRAIALWRSIEEGGEDPLFVEPYHRGREQAVREPVHGAALNELQRKWQAACLDFDENLAERILTQAFAQYPADVVCLEIFQKSLAQVGELWYGGEISVQQEHFTSSLVDRRLKSLIDATQVPVPKGVVIVACPPEEEHAFSSLFVTLRLRQAGWDVIYLGVNVPIDHLRETVEEVKPELLVSPAMSLRSAADLLRIAKAIRESGCAFAYGGRIFLIQPDLRSRIPGHYLGDQLHQVELVIEQVVRDKHEPPNPPPLGEELRKAIQSYADRYGAIEVEVVRSLPPSTDREHLESIQEYFSSNLFAALELGDKNAFLAEMQWLDELLHHRGVPREVFEGYLSSYSDATLNLSGNGSKLIREWLESARELLESGSLS